MISFILSLVALVLGYMVYGKFIARTFGPDDRPTPAITKAGLGFESLRVYKKRKFIDGLPFLCLYTFLLLSAFPFLPIRIPFCPSSLILCSIRQILLLVSP